MSAEAKKGLLPEGGEMLIFAIVLFFCVAGIVVLMYALSPGT